ncbi:hypothetical protein HDU76_011274, partial [Blyttiomyces sp. JEL0837]
LNVQPHIETMSNNFKEQTQPSSNKTRHHHHFGTNFGTSFLFEIKSTIIEFLDTLTRFINNDLTPVEIKSINGNDICKIAFEIDYDEDLDRLPQEHFPNIQN